MGLFLIKTVLEQKQCSVETVFNSKQTGGVLVFLRERLKPQTAERREVARLDTGNLPALKASRLKTLPIATASCWVRKSQDKDRRCVFGTGTAPRDPY